MRVLQKPIFTYYSGGNHGCTNVRQAINREVQNDERCLGAEQRRSSAAATAGRTPRSPSTTRTARHARSPWPGPSCACPEGRINQVIEQSIE